MLGLSLGTGVDLPVVTFRDDDDPADVLRAQRKARNRAPFVVLQMPSVLEEGDIEAGDDLSTRMRKKAAARLRKKGTRSLSPFPSQSEKEAVVAVKLAAFATRREVSDERTSLTRAATSPTWGSEALRRDLESRTWRVYARVGEVRGARCSVPIVIKSQVVLEVGAKISFENTTTTSTKTTRKLDSLAKFTRPKVKDYATDGADFNGERLVVAACVPRSSAHLRVSVYERLKTDLVRTRRLGIATIPPRRSARVERTFDRCLASQRRSVPIELTEPVRHLAARSGLDPQIVIACVDASTAKKVDILRSRIIEIRRPVVSPKTVERGLA